MALFETLRENTKIVLWITVIAFVGLIFLAWGANFTSKQKGGGAEAGVLATVNGEKIYYREFSDFLNQARAIYEAQTGQIPDEEVGLMLQATTWSTLLDRGLIRHEARERGVTVTDREVASALLTNPPARYRASPTFRDEEGQFDMQRWQGFLADPRTNTLPLEAEQRDVVIYEKLKMSLLSGVKVSEAEVRESWLQENEKLNLAVCQIPYFRLLPDLEIEEADLQAHLDQHAEEFRHPERVVLEFVRLEKTLSEEDTLEARSVIQEAHQEIQRGEDYDIIVQAYSEAPPSRSGGEGATWLTRQQISQPEVAEAAFTLPVGEPSDVFLSSDGFHIVRVDERTTEEGQEKVKLAEIFVPLKMSFDTNVALRDRAIDLADSTQEITFSEAAEVMGLAVNRTPLSDPRGFIPGLGRVAAAGEFARRAQPGEISRPIETRDGWYLAHLVERRPEESATLEDVRPRVRTAVLTEKRKQAAQARSQQILQRCQSGVSLEEAAATDTLATFSQAEGATRLGYVRGIGSDPTLTGAAFSADTGLIPYVVLGQQSAFVVETLARAEVDEEAFALEKEETRASLLQEKRNRLLTQWLDELREAADVEDYRLAIASL